MPILARRMTDITNGISFQELGLVLALLLAAPLAAMAQTAPAAPKKVQVVASFTILADMARAVAGDRAEVKALVGPDSDAHVYRATPADARLVKGADLVIINGLNFEGFMPRLIKGSGTKGLVITATSGLKPIEAEEAPGQKHKHGHGHDHGKSDPHAWQSVKAAKTYVSNIRDGLVKADPAGADTYKRNAEAYLAELVKLKAEIEALFASVPAEKRIAITSHDALAYFGREFKVTLEAVQGVSTEGEPSAKDVARIIRLAREKKARAVFVENMTNPRIAERIAAEAGAKLGGKLFSDALSDEKGPAATYIAMMRHNAGVLAAAFRD